MTTSTPALQLLLAAQAPLAAGARQRAPGWLTGSEEARLAGMQNPARREEFIACRYALRQLLAMAHGTTADHWRLDAPEGRAPHLNAQHHGEEVTAATHLSLSHSAAYLACAAAPHPVGIDLEVKDLESSSRRDVLALAGMACTPGELAQLQPLDDGPARQRHFLQIWSLKEAYFKCMGTGVDFAAIRRIECQPAGLPSRGQVLVHARAWQGTTAGGHAVLLSVCVLGAGGLPPCSLQVDADVAWQGDGDWRLVALPG